MNVGAPSHTRCGNNLLLIEQIALHTVDRLSRKTGTDQPSQSQPIEIIDEIAKEITPVWIVAVAIDRLPTKLIFVVGYLLLDGAIQGIKLIVLILFRPIQILVTRHTFASFV